MHKDKPIVLQMCYALSLIVAILLPLLIWRLNLPIVQATYDGSAPGTLESQPFEIFGLLVTILLGTTTWLRVAKQPGKNVATLVPLVLPLLVLLNLLFIQVETFHTKSSDFMCYENAARAILGGTNPYLGTPPCYLYPPLLAQVLALFHQIAVYNPFFSFTDDQAWTVATYFYQCGQFLQVILAYYLTFTLAQHLRLQTLPASLLVSALFLFNYPLVRTLTFDQVNLWLLNSFMLGILLLQRYPFLGGLSIALGAHIKVYTLALLFPWLPTRRWRAITGVSIWFVVIALIQTGLGSDWTLWEQFLDYFRSPEKPSNYRNNGTWSLVFNIVKIPGRFMNSDAIFSLVPFIVAGLNLLILLWFTVRFFQRERIYSKMIRSTDIGISSSWAYIFRFYGHSIDAIAISLLISPSVWEHHYVIAIPVTLFAIVTRQSERPWIIGIGTFLIFCIPTFEIFPLSFHRLAGLLIVTYLISPVLVQNYFSQSIKKF